MTHAHALVVGLAQLVSRPSAPFHASTAVVSPLPLNAYVMQAGEEPTAIKACQKIFFGGSACFIQNSLTQLHNAVSCDPPCQNGGTCVISGFCLCPLEWQGPLCEYSR